MEGIRPFLESSTIHGLRYISTTRKYVRLFWILVVLTGFLGAILLIKESFESWSEDPVKTTVETLSISEIRLPKVTVCPPKNTFTDLNYDLMMTENMTLTNEMRDEMFKYAVDVINENSLLVNNWTKFHEKNRFYNWYHGYTEIKSPQLFSSSRSSRLKLVVWTSATSGVITTQYYGEKYQPELVERDLDFSVRVFPPKNNENVTMHFKVEKVSMSQDRVWIDGVSFNAENNYAYTNFTFTPEIYNYQITLLRYDVSSENVDQQELDVMPGIRFAWWHTGAPVTTDTKYKDKEITKHLVR